MLLRLLQSTRNELKTLLYKQFTANIRATQYLSLRVVFANQNKFDKSNNNNDIFFWSVIGFEKIFLLFDKSHPPDQSNIYQTNEKT